MGPLIGSPHRYQPAYVFGTLARMRHPLGLELMKMNSTDARAISKAIAEACVPEY